MYFLSNLPVVSLLQGVNIRNIVQAWVLVSQVVPFKKPLTIFTIEIFRGKEPRTKLLRDSSQILSASHVFQVGLQQLKIHAWRPNLESVLVDHPVRPDRNRGQRRHCCWLSFGCSVDRNTNPSCDPSDVENLATQFGNFAHGFQKDSLSVVPRSFIKEISSVALTFRP